MRYVFAVIILSAVVIPAVAQECTNLWDGGTFLVEEAYFQPRGALRTFAGLLNGRLSSGSPSSHRTAFALGQQIVPFPFPLRLGYGLLWSGSAEWSSGDDGPSIGLNLALPIALTGDCSLVLGPNVRAFTDWLFNETSISNDFVGLSLPLSAYFTPQWSAHVNAGIGCRSSSYGNSIHRRGSEQDGCIRHAEGSWEYRRGGRAVFTPVRNLQTSLEYSRSTYRGPDYHNDWREIRQTVCPGLRYSLALRNGAQWMFGIGAPVNVHNKTELDGMIFNLAYQSAGYKN